MALIINNNLMAMTAARNLGVSYDALAVSTARLSSGLRINTAADDAAGLAVRESMRADIAVLNQGVRNAGDAISLIQTAEGALQVIDEKLIRMKELAEQAATGTYTSIQRAIMDSEYQAMAAEIDRIANASDFNGVKLLNGSITETNSSGMKIHFGTGNESAEDYYYINIGDMRATKSTGLQVGGGATAEVFTNTTNYSLTQGISGGYFAFQYNADGSDTSTLVNTDIAGFYQIASDQTISDAVNTINQGTAARIIGAWSGSNDSTTKTFYIGGTTIEVVSLGTSVTAGAIGISASYAGSTAASFMTKIMVAVNSATFGEVWAISGTSAAEVIFMAKAPGVGGNTASALENVSGFTFTGLANNIEGTLSGGGTTWATASAYQNSNGSYNLRLTGVNTGADYDIEIVDVSLSAIGQQDVADAAWDNAASDEWTETEATGSGSWNGADILTQSAAQLALAQITDAIDIKDNARASLGATANRLENTITNLTVQAENLQAAESRVSDVDVASEMTEFTKNSILVQAATAMLAQANSLPQLALQLLGG